MATHPSGSRLVPLHTSLPLSQDPKHTEREGPAHKHLSVSADVRFAVILWPIQVIGRSPVSGEEDGNAT